MSTITKDKLAELGRGERVANMVAVGRTDHRSVRVWCRVPAAGMYRLTLFRGSDVVGTGEFSVSPDNLTDDTRSVAFPDDFPGQPALSPLTRYRFEVASTDGDTNVGHGQFETFPERHDDTPARFKLCVLSCHQPFRGDDGALDVERTRTLHLLPRALADEREVKFLLATGDQMYSDQPETYSLLRLVDGEQPFHQWDPAAIRAAYHERYRTFWHPPPWRKLVSSYPFFPILDDHEVFDDWGSIGAHHDQDGDRIADEWARVFIGARYAYMDYQGAMERAWDGRALGSNFSYHFDYGHTGVFVFDLRSERARTGPFKGRVYSSHQLARFEQFLDDRVDSRVLVMVTSVPLIHIPEWLSRLGHLGIPGHSPDFTDHWSTDHNKAGRDAILELVYRQLARTAGRQKIVFIGGDVHIGAGFVLTQVGGDRHQFYQFTSSPVSTSANRLEHKVSALGPQLFNASARIHDGTLDARLLKSVHSNANLQCNPITVQNAGIIEVATTGPDTRIKFRFLAHDLRTPDILATCFESGWL